MSILLKISPSVLKFIHGQPAGSVQDRYRVLVLKPCSMLSTVLSPTIPTVLILPGIQPWSSPPGPWALPWALKWVFHSLQFDLFCPFSARGHNSPPRTVSTSETPCPFQEMHLYPTSVQSSVATEVTQTILDKEAGALGVLRGPRNL